MTKFQHIKIGDQIATWRDAVEAIKSASRAALAQARRSPGHYVPRQAMVLATNEHGRVGDPVHYSFPGQFTIRQLKSAASIAMRLRTNEGVPTGVCIEGGVDRYESMRAMMNGEDYDPEVEAWEVELPAHLLRGMQR